MRHFENATPTASEGGGAVEQTGGLTPSEVQRIRRLLKAFPDENAADQAVELFETYRAMGRVGKLMLWVLKTLTVISAGVIAYFHLRGLWGKGGH